jgi:thioredoxin-like negative regulator of GroEL
MLLRVAAQWNWLGDAEDLLWRLISRYPGEKWARDGLARMLLSDGRTRSLMALYGQEAQASPADLSAKNNLAMLALLLDARELRPHELAREVYLKSPANPFYASTYAFSLHIQDKSADALKVFQRLKPQELEQPSIAVYYGMVLQATGNSNKAKKYLDLASKAPLLPEERKLVDRARAGV